jgi:DNA repair protein RadC
MIVRYYGVRRRDGLLSLEVEKEVEVEKSSLSSPEDTIDFLINDLDMKSLDEEYLFLIALDNKLNLLGISELSHGTNKCSLSNKRGAGVRLLLMGASHFMIVHNHPSGDSTPSKEDYDTTKAFKELGALLDIKLVDSIICGKVNYSFQQCGGI